MSEDILFIVFATIIAYIIFITVFYIRKKIKIDENQQLYLKLLQRKIQENTELETNLEKTIQNLTQQKSILQATIKQQETAYEKYKTTIKQKQQEFAKKANEQCAINIQETQQFYNKQKQKIETEYIKYVTNIGQQKKQIREQLEKLQNTLNAAIQNDLRERQKKDKINFYKLSITDSDLSDVQMLQNLKSSFHKPVVLSKLIWSQYFQKQMTDLCNRILNNRKNVCGIYKITNLITGEHYIGQSKNIDERWKAHCKCGLGIEAPATNTLYNSMQKDKVWNFTFEVLQECKPGELNEKEAFWIQSYQSNVYGLNTQKGVTKK